MNVIRILINIVLALSCLWGGVYLLAQPSFFLRDRWQSEFGTYFSGVSLYLLAGSLFFLSAFVFAVTQAWIRGIVPMPNHTQLQPHSAYKGQLIMRYWYFLLPAFVMLTGGFVLAVNSANPAL